jgi:hypothetical protein
MRIILGLWRGFEIKLLDDLYLFGGQVVEFVVELVVFDLVVVYSLFNRSRTFTAHLIFLIICSTPLPFLYDSALLHEFLD